MGSVRPRVTVVTPAYNAATTLGDTIRSVLAQTVSEWEMIIVDDGSTDDTVRVASSFSDPRVRCITGSHTGLPALARNRGIQEARAPRVAFIDSDDMWLPRFLERGLAALEEAQATLIHCAWMNLADGRLHLERPRCPAGVLEGRELLRLLVRQHVMSCCAVVADRRALLDCGLFDSDPGLRGPEDFDLWLRLAGCSRFVHIPDRLLIVRVRPDSISRNVVGNLSGSILALRKLRQRQPDSIVGIAGDYHDRLSYLLFELGVHKLVQGLAGAGRAELREALLCRPLRVRSWFWLGLSYAGPTVAKTWGRFRRRVPFPLRSRNVGSGLDADGP